MTDRQFSDHMMPHYKSMYGVALAMTGNPDQAADTVQDVMLQIWSKRREIELPATAKAYLLTAVRNRCISDRRLCRVEQCDISNCQEPAAMETADSSAVHSSTAGLISMAIDAMPETMAEVMRLSLFGECSNSEIEQITGLSAVNVRAMLSRGRRRLRSLFTNPDRTL